MVLITNVTVVQSVKEILHLLYVIWGFAAV